MRACYRQIRRILTHCNVVTKGAANQTVVHSPNVLADESLDDAKERLDIHGAQNMSDYGESAKSGSKGDQLTRKVFLLAAL